MTKKIIFSSGGTGGHILPAINLMKYLSKKGHKILLVTDARGNNFLKKYPELEVKIIKTDTPIKKNFVKKITSLLSVAFAILQSIFLFKREKPQLIFGFGGYVSFPISFVSKLFNIPLVIYENNLVLGRANKILLPIAKKILLGTEMPINFPEKYKKKTHFVGNILKEEIINYSVSKKQNEDKVFSILVLGGSQGAEIFGKVIPSVIKMIKEQGHEIKINQQCIENQKDSLIEFYNNINIKNNIFDFTDKILDLISSSDLAISRCGASTAAELVHTLTPFIAIPYPHSMDNHQYLNAKHYESKDCCWVVEQDNLITTKLFNLIIEIINDKKKLENVRESMKKNFSKNVYIKVENALKEFIEK